MPINIALKKKGEKVTTTFKFSPDIDVSIIDDIVEELKITNVNIDENDSNVVLEIEN